MSKNKHLTLDDRIEIQECLAKAMSLSKLRPKILMTRKKAVTI